jgi:hypothetical protein
LFPVADDEDGGCNRIARRAEAFAPALDELPDQLPLRAAGVLKLVHQHMTVARLEPQAALRELIHILQQLDGPLEHPGEIEQRVRLQRVGVLLERDGENPPHAARHDGVQIAPEAPDLARDERRDLRGRGPMALPGVRAVAVVGREAGAGELVAARLPSWVRKYAAGDRRARETRPALRGLKGGS